MASGSISASVRRRIQQTPSLTWADRSTTSATSSSPGVHGDHWNESILAALVKSGGRLWCVTPIMPAGLRIESRVSFVDLDDADRVYC